MAIVSESKDYNRYFSKELLKFVRQEFKLKVSVVESSPLSLLGSQNDHVLLCLNYFPLDQTGVHAILVRRIESRPALIILSC